MSNILKRLRALKSRKDESPHPDTSTTPEPPVSDSGESISDRDPARQNTLDSLRAMIRTVSDRSRPTPAPPWSVGSNGVLSPELFEGPGQSIDALIPGECLQTPYGPCFRVRSEYPWQYHHGRFAIAETLDLSFSCLQHVLSDDRLHHFNLKEALFFDTETTGLDTGSGTYIFLAGFGYFEDRNFIVEQFFMRDFPEEPAVIDRIAALLARFRFIVSFNGRTYDWPLLQTRFIMNRRSLPSTDPPHLDLLTMSRRLFRYGLDSCALSNLERAILGFHRIDDLPGALLPGLYFKYQRSRDARYIHKAFAHNAHDVVSMAALLQHVTRLMADPFNQSDDAAVLYAIGRIMEDRGQLSDAERGYRDALRIGIGPDLHWDALQRLSLLLKNQGRWDDAIEIWQLMKRSGPNDLFPYIELAKRFEHGTRNYEAAINEVRDAMACVDSRQHAGREALKALEHRLHRLEAKASGKPWRTNSVDTDDETE